MIICVNSEVAMRFLLDYDRDVYDCWRYDLKQYITSKLKLEKRVLYRIIHVTNWDDCILVYKWLGR
jgi:hypothetical protein